MKRKRLDAFQRASTLSDGLLRKVRQHDTMLEQPEWPVCSSQ